MKDQKQWVKDQLNDKGFITRNECLQNYVSRLGAIICDLKHEGYEFTTEYQKTPNGKDYVYTFIKSTHNQNQLFKTFNL